MAKQLQLDDAIHRVVHDYPGGAVALAPRVGMRPGTLSNKANPGCVEHNMTLLESIPIQRESHDYRILHAYAANLDHVAVPLADYSGVSDVELLDAYASYHAEVGRLAGEIRDALADGRITQHELAAIRTASDEAARARQGLLMRLEALAEGDDHASAR